MYQEIKYLNGKVLSIKKLANENNMELFIPLDPDNSDYAEYLRWLSEGNQPTPAEEQGA